MGGRCQTMVDPEPDHARPGWIDQILGDGIVAGMRGEEGDTIGGRQGQCGQPAVVLPRLGAREVRGIVVADQVLLGQDQPVAECSQEGQIARVAQLKRPVDDIRPRTAGDRGLTIGDERYAALGLETPDRILARVIGHDNGQADLSGPGESGDDLECMHMRPDRCAVKDAGVDHRREAGYRPPDPAGGAGRGGWGHAVFARSDRRRRSRTPIQDEHVIGEHVKQAGLSTPPGELGAGDRAGVGLPD